MKQSLRTILAATLLILPLYGTMASNVADTLVIVGKEGKTIYKIALVERPKVYYSTSEAGCGLLVEAPSKTFQTFFAMSDVERFYFIPSKGLPASTTPPTTGSQTVTVDFEADRSAIDEIPEQTTVSFGDDGSFRISGVKNPSSVRVFTIGGRQDPAAISMTGSDSMSISLNALPQGYYIITVDKQSYKIYKK